MYSSNPGSVDPSAKSHVADGDGSGATVCDPLTSPIGSARSKYIERSAITFRGDVTPMLTPVRPRPTTALTSTVVLLTPWRTRVSANGAVPSSKLYVTET
jgi:hypothetical protein